MPDELNTTVQESTPTSSTETLSQTPERFSVAVGVERQRLENESPTPTRTETTNTIVHQSTNELFGVLQSGDFWKKALLIAGVATAAYVGAKALKSGVESIRGMGDSVRSAISETAGNTLRSVLAVGLGAGAAGTIYEAVQGKIPMQDVLREYRQGGATGLGQYLLGKVRDGVISIPQDGWNAIAGRLGLPDFSSITETVSAGMEWLDEHTHFSELKERMVSWFNEHNMDAPSWLPNLNLNRIAGDMGISRENVPGWTRFGGLAGGSFLIYRWVKEHGMPSSTAGRIGGAVGINAAVYLLLLQDGQQSFGREMMGDLGSEITGLKNNLIQRLGDDHPEAVGYINEAFSMGSSAAGIMGTPISQMLDWAGRHPMEAMAIGNAMWFFRAKLMSGIVTLIRTGGNVARNNPAEAMWGAAAAAGLWYARGEVINRLVDYAYEDPESADAVSMRQYFHSLLEVDPDAEPTLLQQQIPDFYKSILEDPMAALRSPEVIDDIENGNMTVNWDVSGRAWLVVKGFNVPWQMMKLTWTSFTTTMGHIFNPEENENGVVVPMMVGGAEMMVFGAATWGGFKGYKSLMEIAQDRAGGKMWAALKTLNPLSQEWRFVLKSSMTAPLVPFLKARQQMRMVSLSNDLQKIRSLAAETPPNITELRTLTRRLSNSPVWGTDMSDIQKSLAGSDFSYQLGKKMEDGKTLMQKIYSDVLDGKADDIARKVGAIEEAVGSYQRTASILQKRMQLIFSGEFRQAIAAEKELFENMPKVTPRIRPEFEIDEMFKGKTTRQLQEEVADLMRRQARETLSEADAKKLRMLQTFLAPSGFSEAMSRGTMEFANEARNMDEATKVRRITELTEEFATKEQAMQSRFLADKLQIETAARAAGKPLTDPDFQRRINQLDELYTQPMARAKENLIKQIQPHLDDIPPGARTARYKAGVKNVVESEGSFLAKCSMGVKGRMKMMALMASMMFATDAIITANDPEREMSDMFADMGDDMMQLVIDCLPVTGTFSNFYSAFTGEELLTDRDVSDGWSRASNAVWGVVGAAGDILTVIGTAGTGGAGGAALVPANVSLRLGKVIKAGGQLADKAKDLLTKWPRIQRIIERMGGVRPFGEKLIKYMREGARAAQNNERLINGLRRVERVGMGVGVTLLAGGVANMAYGFVADVPEIDPSTYA